MKPGAVQFQRGREALLTWLAHRYVGAVLAPPQPQIAVGTDVVVALRVRPASVVVPCRIISVTDTDEAFGFAYGTLPGHPEQGEEAFHICRADDIEITFEIRALRGRPTRWHASVAPLRD